MDGFARLAGVLQTKMQQQAKKEISVNLELGTIGTDFTLLLDSVPDIVIPKDGYLVNRALTMQDPMVATEIADLHTHVVNVPEQLKGLSTGDRVLVAWPTIKIPIVIAVVVKNI